LKNGRYQIVITRHMLKTDIRYIIDSVQSVVGDVFDIVIPDSFDEAGILMESTLADVYLGPFITQKLLSSASQLKLIQVPWTGMDTFDFAAIQGFEIPICNTHSNANAVAELGLALVLDVLKKISYHDRKMRIGSWNREQQPLNLSSKLLSSQKVCILGYGNIGGRLGRLISGFGSRIVAVDVKSENGQIYGHNELHLAYKPEEWLVAVSEADITICTLPLTDSTRNLINAEALSQFITGSILINISRAEIIEENSLYEALRNGKLSGFASDVWWDVPKRGESHSWPSKINNFTTFDNILLSPHRAGYVENALPHLDGAIENIIRLVKGQELMNQVDKRWHF